MVNDVLNYLDQLNFASILIRIFMATITGSLIGLNRAKIRQPAGMRTHILVCVGAAVGAGFYFVAVVVTMVEMVVLTRVKGWEQKLMPENVQFHLYMETRTTTPRKPSYEKWKKWG